MKSPAPELLTGPLATARRFAALSGPFDPLEALPTGALSDKGPAVASMVATLLARYCDTNPPGAEGRWLMRPTERSYVLEELSVRNELAGAAEQRIAAEHDDETEDLVAVLLDRAPLDRRFIQKEIEASTDRETLERIVLALDRAADAAPASDLLIPARIAVAGLNTKARTERARKRPFVGREDELDRIAQWIGHPRFDSVECLFVTGAPGIGKSSLVGHAVSSLQEVRAPLVLRLDFDRAGLDVQDLLGLTLETSRQIAEQLGREGAHLLEARLDAAGAAAPQSADAFSLSESASPSEMAPRDLMLALGQAALAAARPIVIVLDTLEVLRGRGDSHPQALFAWLADLAGYGMRPLSVIAAGRGDALDSCPDRVADTIRLPGLPDQEATKLLEIMEVPRDAIPEVLRLADGNPLRLRLGAEIMRRVDLSELPRRLRRRSVEAAFLYRFLLSRIEDPTLRKLAHPGLIVRRISAAVIAEVLAPNLGMGRLTLEHAQRLLDELATHHWLLESDADPLGQGYLKHRADMRVLLLPMLYKTAPQQAARINRAAAAWFGRLQGPWAEVESAYHSLQLMRSYGATPPPVPWRALTQIDEEMVAELPEPAQDYVLVETGRRGRTARVGQDFVPDDGRIADELIGVMGKGDWREGSAIARTLLERGGMRADSLAAEALRTFLWRSGRWALARLWLSQRDALVDHDEDLNDLPPQLALARLEMLAEFHPRRAVALVSRATFRIENLAETAVQVSDNLARHGALPLQLTTNREAWPHLRAGSGDADLVAAALAAWTEGGRDRADPDLRGALRIGQERVLGHLPLLAQAIDDPPIGQLLGSLSPYPVIAQFLSTGERHRWLIEHAGVVVERVRRRGAFLILNGPGDRGKDANPITALTELGLGAEWLAAAAFASRDADLGLLGRCAERWRRTMAGRWSYLHRPKAWRGSGAVDSSLRVRSEALLRGAAAHEPLDEIEAWTGPGPSRSFTDRALAEHTLGRLKRRYRDTIAKANKENELDAVMARLLRGNVPAAYVPALASLIIHHEL